MATLEKKTLIGLLGQKAGTRLFNWLSPCCQLTFRTEAVCIEGKICISIYGTSPTTQTVFIQGNFGGLLVRVTPGYYSFIAGEETLLSYECLEKGNPPEGTYNGFFFTLETGSPIIGYLVTVDIPFCDG
jgi:hypothetical protein